MLPKPERLTKEDFTGVRPKVFFRCELFDMATLSTSSKKYACVISKKTLKRAVDRNTVKRRVLTSVRECKPENKPSIVIYPKKEVLHTSYKELQEKIQQAFATL